MSISYWVAFSHMNVDHKQETPIPVTKNYTTVTNFEVLLSRMRLKVIVNKKHNLTALLKIKTT